MKTDTRSKKGAALALVLIGIVILSVLGVGLLQLGFHARRQSIRTAQELAARSAADAGLTWALFGDPPNYDPCSGITWPYVSNLYSVSSENFSVGVVPDDTNFDGTFDTYNITSTGYAAGGLIAKVVRLSIEDSGTGGTAAEGAGYTEDGQFDGAATTDGQNDYIMTVVGAGTGLTGRIFKNTSTSISYIYQLIKVPTPFRICAACA